MERSINRSSLSFYWLFGYCGFVWFQKNSSYTGFNPTPAGFYDSIHGRDKLVPAQDFKIRDENLSAYWNERRQRKLKRR